MISWLFEQDAIDRYQRKTDFYKAVKMPYVKARDLLGWISCVSSGLVECQRSGRERRRVTRRVRGRK